MPAYHAHAPQPQTFRTGPGRAAGFNAATSTAVASAASATTDLYKNADGTYTRLVYPGPVNYRDSAGAYRPIKTTLAAGSGGRWQEKANSVAVTFAASAADPVLGSLSPAPGEDFSFSLAGSAAVTGVASGSSVTYSGVFPDTGLVETSVADGIKESLVLNSASAPASWVFPLNLTGLTAVATADGEVNLVDAAGNVQIVIPHGFATDSAFDPQSGNPARTEGVTYQLVSYQGGQALQVSLDQAWLDDPARVFPVTVDPTGDEGATGSTYVLYPYSNDYSGDSLMQSARTTAGPTTRGPSTTSTT